MSELARDLRKVNSFLLKLTSRKSSIIKIPDSRLRSAEGEKIYHILITNGRTVINAGKLLLWGFIVILLCGVSYLIKEHSQDIISFSTSLSQNIKLLWGSLSPKLWNIFMTIVALAVLVLLVMFLSSENPTCIAIKSFLGVLLKILFYIGIFGFLISNPVGWIVLIIVVIKFLKG